MKEIILTQKEIMAIYHYCNNIKQSKFVYDKYFNNVVIKQEPCGGIGSILYIQTQNDFWKKSKKWEDITDYEAW